MTAPQSNQGPRPRLGLAILAAGIVAIVALVAGSAVVLAGGDPGGGGGDDQAESDQAEPDQGAPGSADPEKPPASELADTGRPAKIEIRPVVQVIPKAKNCGSNDIWCSADGPEAYRLGPAVLQTADIVNAEARVSSYGDLVVGISLSDSGATKFETVTRELSENAGAVDPQLAVVVDDVVISAPIVQGAIPGGEIDISARFTQAEAEQLAAAIDP
jgi:preprotein translocase subunit SecD